MANAAVWLGVGAYLFFMARTQQQLDKRIRQMELMNDD
jgi:CcmD family protein